MSIPDKDKVRREVESHDRLAAKVRDRYPEAEPALIPEPIMAVARAFVDGELLPSLDAENGIVASKSKFRVTDEMVFAAIHRWNANIGEFNKMRAALKAASELVGEPDYEAAWQAFEDWTTRGGADWPLVVRKVVDAALAGEQETETNQTGNIDG